MNSIRTASSIVVFICSEHFAQAANCGGPASPCFDSDALWPTAGANTFLSVPTSRSLVQDQLNIGLVTSWQRNPLLLRTSEQGPAGEVGIPVIQNQVTSTFLFAYALLSQLQFEAALPVTWFQNGNGLQRLNPQNDTPLASTVVRDLRVGAAYEILSFAHTTLPQGIGLTARLDLSVPIGNREYFASNANVVGVPSIVVENRWWHFMLTGQFGARLRSTTQFLSRTIGSQLMVNVGLAAFFDRKEHVAITAEISALPSLVHDGVSPVQWLIGLRGSQLWNSDFSIYGGFGAGFRPGSQAALTEPTWRLALDLRYTPRAFP